MAENSLIEWTDATWNPLLGCDKCSAGCARCYAIRTAWRLQHNPNQTIADAYEGLVEKRADGSLNWTGRINLLPERLREPMQWNRPRRIFVNSQSDLFHAEVPDDFIDQVFAVMALCPHHTFQILTKRPERMCAYLTASGRLEAIYAQWYGLSGSSPEVRAWPLPNVWLGTSIENQRAADDRILWLLDTPAKVRFLSCEPLLGPVNLDCYGADVGPDACWPEGIDWVICGGESGPNARPMELSWAQDLRDQCAAAGIPFLFKQWGEYIPKGQIWADGTIYHGPLDFWQAGKARAGRQIDGREWNEFPEFKP